MSEIIGAWRRFVLEFESMRDELKDTSDTVAALDKRIEQLERMFNG